MGMESHSSHGKDVAKRSSRYLSMLGRSAGSVQLELALYQLTKQYDLLDVEFIEEPTVLELQRELHRLAETNEDARAILTDRVFGMPPVVRLTEAILAQAMVDRAHTIFVFFGDGSSPFTVEYEINEKRIEAMTVPALLSEPLRQSFLRVEGLGHEIVKRYWYQPDKQPESLTFEWLSNGKLKIAIA